MTEYEDLISYLRAETGPKKARMMTWEITFHRCADAIEALVKERDEFRCKLAESLGRELAARASLSKTMENEDV